MTIACEGQPRGATPSLTLTAQWASTEGGVTIKGLLVSCWGKKTNKHSTVAGTESSHRRICLYNGCTFHSAFKTGSEGKTVCTPSRERTLPILPLRRACPKPWGAPGDLQPGEQWAVAAYPGSPLEPVPMVPFSSDFPVSWQQPRLGLLLSHNDSGEPK